MDKQVEQYQKLYEAITGSAGGIKIGDKEYIEVDKADMFVLQKRVLDFIYCTAFIEESDIDLQEKLNSMGPDVAREVDRNEQDFLYEIFKKTLDK